MIDRASLAVLMLSLCIGAPTALGAEAVPPTPDGAEWNVVNERDGVVVSQRLEPGFERPASRGVTTLDASLFDVLAVIQDVPRHPEWRGRCVEARVLERNGDSERTLYSRDGGSWPVSDRDAVIRSTLASREWGRDALVSFRSIEWPDVPPIDGVVRMPQLAGHYALQALGPDRTRIEYVIKLDLGGWVPEFASRFTAEEMPIDTLTKLRAQLEKQRGSYTALIEEWEGRGEKQPQGGAGPAE